RKPVKLNRRSRQKKHARKQEFILPTIEILDRDDRQEQNAHRAADRGNGEYRDVEYPPKTPGAFRRQNYQKAEKCEVPLGIRYIYENLSRMRRYQIDRRRREAPFCARDNPVEPRRENKNDDRDLYRHGEKNEYCRAER